MGYPIPADPDTRGAVAGPRDARNALVAAGAFGDLDASLQETVSVLAQRFAADLALIGVYRHSPMLHSWPAEGPLSAAEMLPHAGPGSDPDYRAVVEEPGPGVDDDLTLKPNLTPSQRAAVARGMRSSMRIAMFDERGEPLGFIVVMSNRTAAFTPAMVDEFSDLAGLAATFIRPAILVAAINRERELLAEEARLLTLAASAQDETELLEGIVDGVRRALACDMALLLVRGVEPGETTLLVSPEGGLTAGQVADMRPVIGGPGNSALLRVDQDGCRVNRDLATQAETPIEAFLFQTTGLRGLAAAVRRGHGSTPGQGIAVLKAAPGGWRRDQRSFLDRVSRVVEIAVERMRRGEQAIEQAASLERQAGLIRMEAVIFESLAHADGPDAAFETMARKLREFFGAEHLLFGVFDVDRGTRDILGFSSDVVGRDGLLQQFGQTEAADYMAAHRAGTQTVPDLMRIPDLPEGPSLLRDAGVRSLVRIPFRLSDGTPGIITLGHRQPERFDAEVERALLDLLGPLVLAIERLQLVARLGETAGKLEAKTHVLSALRPGATIESAGSVFVEEARRLFHADHCALSIVRRGDIRVIAVASDVFTDEEMRQFEGRNRTLEQQYAQRLEKGNQVIGDLRVHERTAGEDALLAKGCLSAMRVPISDRDGRARGVVTLASRQVRAWDSRDLETFGELAGVLGLVTERARLFAEATQQSERLQALMHMLGAFSLSAPAEEVARQFATELKGFLGADAVMVGTFDHEAGQRQLIAVEGIASQLDRELTTPLAESSSFNGLRENPVAVYHRARPETCPPWFRELAERLGLASGAVVRIDANGEGMGFVAAGSVTANRIDDRAVDLMRSVAGPLGMLMERARVMTSLQEQDKRTRAVLDILSALGPQESFADVAGPVAGALRAIYRADHCTIGLIAGETVTYTGVDSIVAGLAPGQQVASRDIIGQTPLARGATHVVPSLRAGPGPQTEIGRMLQAAGLDCYMRALIGTPGEPLGVVAVAAKQAGRFTEADARQLAQIIQPLAVALRYFRGREEAQRRTDRLEVTNRILTRLSAGGTAEHLAQAFLAECRQLFGAQHAVLMQFDHEAGTGRHLAMDTGIPQLSVPHERSLGELHTARIIRHPAPHIVTDIRNEPGLNARHQELMAAGMFSALRAPLVVSDTVKGAVSLWADGAGHFDVEDAELLGTLTRPLALALEKAAALESLAESELKYRSLVAQADEMIFLFDSATHRILDANAFTARALGYQPHELTKLLFDHLTGQTPEELAAHIAATLAEGELHLSDARYLRKDGTTIDVDAVASLVAYGGRQAILVLARDVSERKALIGQLVQSQKMDSLGVMAGAVAHDFNNLLTTILGFAGLLKRSRNMDAEERENLALIEDAARRAADLTGRLLSFSRGGLVQFGRIDLRNVLEDTMKLAEPTLHAGIAVGLALPEEPVYVEGDAGQLQQAFTNIILNARDVLAEGGSITVALRVEAPVAIVTIHDTGPGMDDETRMRIFEPFFTTKPAGSGTGLGGAITFGIVQGHHGDVTVASEPGQGTRFTITLPLYNDPHGGPTSAFDARDGNLVLVVDDDDMVRRATTATLAELGYNVVEAPGGATAVEIVRARPDRFSVVLLDLVMPGMTGSETFRALTAIRPDLPVVVCTGFAADAHIDTDVKRRVAGLIQKPFTSERLARALATAGSPAPRATPGA